jgi:hypothetical protein
MSHDETDKPLFPHARIACREEEQQVRGAKCPLDHHAVKAKMPKGNRNKPAGGKTRRWLQ